MYLLYLNETKDFINLTSCPPCTRLKATLKQRVYNVESICHKRIWTHSKLIAFRPQSGYLIQVLFNVELVGQKVNHIEWRKRTRTYCLMELNLQWTLYTKRNAG